MLSIINIFFFISIITLNILYRNKSEITLIFLEMTPFDIKNIKHTKDVDNINNNRLMMYQYFNTFKSSIKNIKTSKKGEIYL